MANLSPSQRRENYENSYDDPNIWNFFFGHCPAIDSYLRNKQTWIWFIPNFLNAFFRGIAQVVFCNNPFTGTIILTGLLWCDVTVGLFVLICTTIAIFIAMITKQNPESITSGYISFNAVLIACVTSSLWKPLYNQPLDIKLASFIIGGAIFSVLLTNALTNILSSFKPTLPVLSVPFHIVAFITFVCLKPNEFSDTLQNETDFRSHDLLQDLDNSTNIKYYSWETVYNTFYATILSSGQVFGVAHLPCSILVYASILLYSPLLTVMCYIGAIVGTVLGVVLTEFPNEEVFAGVWGFNGFLSCGAIGLFYIYNSYSLAIGICNAVFTAMLQLCLSPSFAAVKIINKTNHIPVFGLPFILSTLLFVCVSNNGRQLVRTSKITYPELQRRMHFRQLQLEQEIGIVRKLVEEGCR